jgi:hypothetical protein
MASAKQQFQLIHPDAYCRVDQYDNYHINSTNDEGRPTKYGYSIVSEDNAWQNALNNLTTAQEADKAK